MAVEVKILSGADLDLLLTANTTVFDHQVDPLLARAYLDHPDYCIALALDGDKVVGMATGLTHFHPDKPREFFVNEVGVAESHQRQGIARRLMAALFGWARERGAVAAWVGTEMDNAPARALYRSLQGGEEVMAFYTFDLSRP